MGKKKHVNKSIFLLIILSILSLGLIASASYDVGGGFGINIKVVDNSNSSQENSNTDNSTSSTNDADTINDDEDDGNEEDVLEDSEESNEYRTTRYDLVYEEDTESSKEVAPIILKAKHQESKQSNFVVAFLVVMTVLLFISGCLLFYFSEWKKKSLLLNGNSFIKKK